MKNNNEEFVKELDIIVKDVWQQIIDRLAIGKEIAIITDVNFFIEDKRVKELLTKYELKADKFDIKMETSKNKYIGNKCKYYYNEMEMKPVCHYIQPKDRREVTLLQMLRECEKQDTHTPDIKHLEEPEK